MDILQHPRQTKTNSIDKLDKWKLNFRTKIISIIGFGIPND